MKKILSIGNSFSYDAHRYLNMVAKANGDELKNVNLYIGGCTMKKHYINIIDDVREYGFMFNGEETGLFVSVREALKSDDWDYITLQQASCHSFDFDNYNPYLERIGEYIDRYSPKAKVLIHQTWGTSDVSAMDFGFEGTEKMFEAVSDAYDKAAKLINADGIIKSGEAMLEAYKQNREIVYRDPIHASLGFGRYMLALVWYRFLFGEKEDFKHIEKFDVPVSEEEKKLAYEIAYKKL